MTGSPRRRKNAATLVAVPEKRCLQMTNVMNMKIAPRISSVWRKPFKICGYSNDPRNLAPA